MKIKSAWFDPQVKIIGLEFPFEVGYFLKRVIHILQSNSKPYFEQKKELVNKYSINGKPEIDPKKMSEFLVELSNLQKIEVDIPIEVLDVAEEDRKEMPKMSLAQQEFIAPFLNFERKEK